MIEESDIDDWLSNKHFIQPVVEWNVLSNQLERYKLYETPLDHHDLWPIMNNYDGNMLFSQVWQEFKNNNAIIFANNDDIDNLFS